MRYGYMMGNGYGGMIVMILLLVVAVFILYMFFTRVQRRSDNPKHDLIIEILKHRYVTNQISADQYLDMKRIVESESGENPELLGLKERYARGEITTEEYWAEKRKTGG